MDQMTLFAPSYRYIIDTSSILSQKPTEPHRRQVYKSLWNKIDDYIKHGVIVTCSEVAEEIKDKSIKEWLHAQRCCILDIDIEIQLNVRKIVSENPKMIEFTNGKGTSSGNVKKCAVGKPPKSEKLGSTGQAACCARIHSRYFTGGSPSGLRV